MMLDVISFLGFVLGFLAVIFDAIKNLFNETKR